ncbi:hypothetical protein [Aeromonas sp. Y311-2]|uniref:hypothetical protein n=1 Tax=Aeromonas sp. Y311-2 TaxID=2990507 RepID=UPI0022DEFC6B|nr:hypothetical protein [Aeromonas sp. Y311-2]
MLLNKSHVRQCPHFREDLLGREPNASMEQFLAMFKEDEQTEIDFHHLMDVMEGYILSLRMEVMRQLIQENSGNGLGLELQKKGKELAVILPEPSARGGVRVSYYSINGPLYHEVFDTVEGAILAAIQSGYRSRHPGALDRLTDLPSWRRGVLWTTLLYRTRGNPTQFLKDNPGYLDS